MREVVAVLSGNTHVFIQIVHILQIIVKAIFVAFLSLAGIKYCLFVRCRITRDIQKHRVCE